MGTTKGLILIGCETLRVFSLLHKLRLEQGGVPKRRVPEFLAWCSNSLRIGRGTLSIEAPGGLGVISTLVFSPHNRAVPPCTILQWKEEV